jgi:hypothetical protein
MTAFELFSSDDGTVTTDGKSDRSTRLWCLNGYPSRGAALAKLQLCAPAINPTDGLVLKSYDCSQIGRVAWIGKVEYGTIEPLEEGEFTWRFDGTGGTVHLSAPYACRKYEAAGVTLPAELEKVINADRDRRVQGVDVPSPTMKLTFSYRLPKAVLTLAYAKEVGKLVGRVNQASFAGCDAYELLFLGPTGSAGTKNAPTLDFAFLYSENVTNLVLGGVTIALKRGHEFAWPWLGDKVDADELVVKPKGFYVDEVCRPGDFTKLQLINIPGGS